MEQLSMFDMIPSVGKWYEEATTEVPFDDLKVGEIYLLDCSTESHKWYLSVMVEKIIILPEGMPRAILYTGKKDRGLVNKNWGKFYRLEV